MQYTPSPPPSRSHPSPRRAKPQIPGWPPYVARADDPDDVVAVPVDSSMSLVVRDPNCDELPPYEPRRGSVPPFNTRQHTPHYTGDHYQGNEPPEIIPPLDEDEMDDIDPFARPYHNTRFGNRRRDVRHNPLLGVSENPFGINIFISRGALQSFKRIFTVLMIIFLVVGLDNVPDAVELVLSVFRF